MDIFFYLLILQAPSVPEIERGIPPIITEVPTSFSGAEKTVNPSIKDGPMCKEEFLAPNEMGILLQEPASEDEYRLLEQAIKTCSKFRGSVTKVSNPFYILALFRLEKELGVPTGLFSGIYCIETTMKARGKYDGKHFGDWWNGEPLAYGPFQLHKNVWKDSCGGTDDAPHDLIWSARCYWANVQAAEEKAKKITKCPKKDILGVAEAAVANITKYKWSCQKRSAHWRVMKMMKIKN